MCVGEGGEHDYYDCMIIMNTLTITCKNVGYMSNNRSVKTVGK